MVAIISVALIRERLAEEREKHRLREELRIAAEIQSRLLPQGEPEVLGFQLAGWSQATEVAGGDTCDFLELSGGQWLTALADASGHGMGPALIADETRAMLRAFAVGAPDAGEIMTGLRELLASDLSTFQFVTCFVGLLDAKSATLSYTSAGQGPILFYDARSDKLLMENAISTPLVGGEVLRILGGELSVRRHRFEPGAFLIAVTDGVYEARNSRGEPFGTQRLA